MTLLRAMLTVEVHKLHVEVSSLQRLLLESFVVEPLVRQADREQIRLECGGPLEHAAH